MRGSNVRPLPSVAVGLVTDGLVTVNTVRLQLVPVGGLPVANMSLGADRRELNGDQQDRRSKHPHQCAGRNHAQLVPYGPDEGNSG
jgi:hypothetical protein